MLHHSTIPGIISLGVEDADKESAPTVVPPPEILEQIIKSPPEPTRVKSPEQIIMRSPDPVNWTVPLDTGKTFTVTQNVREGKWLQRLEFTWLSQLQRLLSRLSCR